MQKFLIFLYSLILIYLFIIACVPLDWAANDNRNNNNATFNNQISLESPLGAESSRDETFNYSPVEDYHNIGFVAESDSSGSPDTNQNIVDTSL